MDKWLHGHSFKILLVEKMNFIFFFLCLLLKQIDPLPLLEVLTVTQPKS